MATAAAFAGAGGAAGAAAGGAAAGAGGGVNSAGAGGEITQLAELLNAPVVTTLNGRGAIPETHRLALGPLTALPQIGEIIAGPSPDPFVYRNWYALVLAAGALGLLLGPYLTIRPFTWIRSQIQHLSGAVLAAGTVGLVIGLFIAVLLAFPLSMLPGQLGRWLPLAAALFYTGLAGAPVPAQRACATTRVPGSRSTSTPPTWS